MTEIVNSEPEFYNEATDVSRLNGLLDAITAKKFVSPVIFCQAVRGACDLHGITLPLLDIEGTNGATSDESKGILYGVSSPDAPAMYAAPVEGEYVFHVEDADGDISDIYLYMVCDQDEKGYFECYAQLVDEDELQSVLNMDERDLPEVPDDNKQADQVRRSRGEPVDDTPPEM
jgi:hypothetical protein